MLYTFGSDHSEKKIINISSMEIARHLTLQTSKQCLKPIVHKFQTSKIFSIIETMNEHYILSL